MSLKPIKNTILFKFIDHVNTKGEFERQRSAGGIFLQAGYDDSAKMPRWATVVRVGPTCEFVTEGQDILIPALRWTPVINHEGESFWKTDEKEVVATRTTGNSSFNSINDYVVFTERKSAAVRSVGVLAVVGGTNDTPSGAIVSAGSKCDPDLQKDVTLYYDKTNFYDTFDVGLTTYSFVKEEKIIAFSI